MKEYKVTAGEELSDKVVELLRDHLMSDTTNGSKHSLRKSIGEAKRTLKIKISVPSIVNVINQYYGVTDNTKPVVEEMVKMALKAKRTKEKKLEALGTKIANK